MSNFSSSFWIFSYFCSKHRSWVHVRQPKRVKCANSAIFVSHLPFHHINTYIFCCLKVCKFNLGLWLDSQVKVKQWKWSIVLPYDVHRQQVPQTPPTPPPPQKKKCCPIDIASNFNNVLSSKWLF